MPERHQQLHPLYLTDAEIDAIGDGPAKGRHRHASRRRDVAEGRLHRGSQRPRPRRPPLCDSRHESAQPSPDDAATPRLFHHFIQGHECIRGGIDACPSDPDSSTDRTDPHPRRRDAARPRHANHGSRAGRGRRGFRRQRPNGRGLRPACAQAGPGRRRHRVGPSGRVSVVPIYVGGPDGSPRVDRFFDGQW